MLFNNAFLETVFAAENPEAQRKAWTHGGSRGVWSQRAPAAAREGGAAATGARGGASRVTRHTLPQCRRPFLPLLVTKR